MKQDEQEGLKNRLDRAPFLKSWYSGHFGCSISCTTVNHILPPPGCLCSCPAPGDYGHVVCYGGHHCALPAGDIVDTPAKHSRGGRVVRLKVQNLQLSTQGVSIKDIFEKSLLENLLDLVEMFYAHQFQGG